jgi:chromosome segregation ATPase
MCRDAFPTCSDGFPTCSDAFPTCSDVFPTCSDDFPTRSDAFPTCKNEKTLRKIAKSANGRRANVEFELRRTKEGIEMYKSQLEPLKEREQQITADLNTEKSKLQELESRLDLLERGIENDRQKLESDKPAAAKNP